MAECRYCVHVQTNLVTGRLKCTNEKALEDLGESMIEEFTEGGEHNCPFFEDDGLPW